MFFLSLSFFPRWSLRHFYKDPYVPHIESVSGLSLSLLPPCPGLILTRVMVWSSSPCPSAKWLQDLSTYHQHASQTSSSPHPSVPPSLVAASSCLPRCCGLLQPSLNLVSFFTQLDITVSSWLLIKSQVWPYPPWLPNLLWPKPKSLYIHIERFF